MVNEERELERDVERLEEQGERVDRHIDKARGDWKSKEQDTSVPGAQPDPDDEEENVETNREESDQLPEEGPSEQVPDDDESQGARDEAEETPGVPEEDETATGNPDAAGAEDPDQ